MNAPQLNLARKWRSKSFDQVVGQPLPVRMLKNSLYLESFFPVYLFSGQRGCGKTTMARVFAAAINCHKLAEFQKNPKNCTVPCLACESCKAMQEGNHADFIEIDAASHTGVDNVRNIIDAASLMPIMGRKKIYLIDEAHMLSKAAFNAFLKILEEPPVSVLFILATTDPEKIIDTVKSRCFQLFFSAVQSDPLVEHLATICTQESIAYERDGLITIVNATQGSVRDAINLLEQVRFSASSVTKQAVLTSLGHLDDERLIELFGHVVSSNPSAILSYCAANNLNNYSAEFIWQSMAAIARAVLWIKYGVKPQQFIEHADRLNTIAKRCSFNTLNEVLEQLYQHETTLKKTTAQHALLEMIFLKVSQKNKKDDNSGASSLPQQAAIASDTHENYNADEESDDEGELDDEIEDDEVTDGSSNGMWALFLRTIPSLQDALLQSLFSQSTVHSFDENNRQLSISFPKELTFFKDWLESTKNQWQPLLNTAFKQEIVLLYHFAGQQTAHKPVQEVSAATQRPTPVQQPAKPVATAPQVREQPNKKSDAKQYKQDSNKPYNSFRKYNTRSEPVYPRIDVSDKTIWKRANMLLDYFPGVIREMQRDSA